MDSGGTLGGVPHRRSGRVGGGRARYMPVRTGARDRVNSNARTTVVFVLNVLAFLLMGLQARAIFSQLRVLGAPVPLARFGVLAELSGREGHVADAVRAERRGSAPGNRF